MRMKSANLQFGRFFVLVILITSLYLGSFITMQNLDGVDDLEVPIKSSTSSYTPHSPILIEDDTDFVSQGWPGYGNETHPYLIEGLEILSDDCCISIQNTAAHFSIVNCNLSATSTYSGNHAISLQSLVNGSVLNCTIGRMFTGIACGDIQNVVLQNNTIAFAWNGGIGISDSQKISMVNNSGSISISRCSVCYIDQHSGSVSLRRSLNCNVTNSDFGIWNLYFEGESVEQFLHNISDNTILGFPVVYVRDISDQIVNPTGIGQLILANCTNIQMLDGIAPVVHHNLAWISLFFSNSCSIVNNVIPECNYALLMWYSHHTHIKGNIIEYAHQTGMHIVDSQNCTIVNNEFYNCMGALHFWGANSNVSYNIVESCGHGLDVGPNSTAIGNVVWNYTSTGINVDGDWSEVKDNIITSLQPSSNTIGLKSGGSNNHFENNTISLVQGRSVHLHGENCTLIDNTFVGKGISMTGNTIWHWMHTMSGNTLDGEPIQYVRNQIGGLIDSSEVSQLIIANCTGLEIKNGVLDEILAVGFCDQILLENNTVSGAPVGFWLVNITNSLVKENSAIDNHAAGFILQYFENCSIEGNLATLHEPDGVGFALQYGTNCTFNSNVVTHNQLGMDLHGVNNFTLEANTFSHNDICGIYISDCTEGVVVSNEITFNDFIGIFVQQSNNIVLYGNNIGYNAYGNAREDVTQNQWDDGVDTGNAWSDYSGSGTYSISGSAGSEDRFPTLLNYEPEIESLSDVECEDGTTAPLLNWTVFDETIDSFIVYVDESVLESGKVNGSFIAVQVGELDLGVHNITLYVNDTVGAYSVDTVFITVVDTTAPTIYGPGNNVTLTTDVSPNELSWTVNDLNPAFFSVYINGSLYISGDWNSTGETITANLDHLDAGYYIVRLAVGDAAGNIAAYIVMVTIETSTTNDPDILGAIVFISGICIIAIIIGVFVRSFRK